MATVHGATSEAAGVESIRTESELAALALHLAGRGRITTAERQLVGNKRAAFASDIVETVRTAILAGNDPLGSAFCRLRSPETRRATGAVYTPDAIVKSMVAWAASEGEPERVVDPGTGSGRFLLAAARAFPKAALVAVETDPLAVLMLRANAAILGVSDRLTVKLTDYRKVKLPKVDGPTLYIGNPPYVRHHDIPEEWKSWLAETAAAFGFKASKLAGLHVHFFLKTRTLAQPGDYGAFLTSAEWLDVNYGSLLRRLLANGMGGASLYVLPPETMPFADAITTGAITCFRIGRRTETMTLRSVDSLDDLNGLTSGKAVPWSDLEHAPRWSPFLRATAKRQEGYVELGELVAVHRGQVTGANAVWIAGAYPGELPKRVLIPTVTKARDLLAAGAVLSSPSRLRKVIDLPAGLDALDPDAAEQVREFLKWAKRQGAHESYIARHRRAWWAVGLYEPAPILCTYMARRAPAFVRNRCGARHLNIAHGLYPRERLPARTLDALAAWLQVNVTVEEGRTYAGGLTKFEPKELERVLVPRLESLHGGAENLDTGRNSIRRGKGDGHLSRGAA